MILPQIQDGVILHSLGDELVGYKQAGGTAFCLNATCALVAELCQKGLTEQEASAQISSKLSINLEQAEAVLTEGLEQLRVEGIIQDSAVLDHDESRRRILKLGTMAAMVPLVASVAMPSPAAAASLNCDAPATVVVAGAGTVIVPVPHCGGTITRTCIVLSGSGGGGGGGGGGGRTTTGNYTPANNNGSAGDAGVNGDSVDECFCLNGGSTVTFTIGAAGQNGSGATGATINAAGNGGVHGDSQAGDPNSSDGVTGNPGVTAGTNDNGGGGGGGGSGAGGSTAVSSHAALLARAAGGQGGKGGNGGNGLTAAGGLGNSGGLGGGPSEIAVIGIGSGLGILSQGGALGGPGAIGGNGAAQSGTQGGGSGTGGEEGSATIAFFSGLCP